MQNRRTVYFVCTGNTCRSPMAETLFGEALKRAGLAERFVAASFGLAANSGEAATLHARNVAQELGGDLSLHRSRNFDEIVPEKGSVFIAMTPRHAQALREIFPDVFSIGDFLPRGTFPREIPDPFGGTEDDYRDVCGKIVSAFPQLLAFLQNK